MSPRVAVMEGLTDRPPKGTETVICSPTYATWNKDYLRRQSWQTLILDEAHAFKNGEAKRTRAIFGKKGGSTGEDGGIVHAAYRVWALTGTPAPSNVAELHPLLKAFGRTKKTYDQFVKLYCNAFRLNYGKPGCGVWKIKGLKKDKVEAFRLMLKPIILRRKKADVGVELPLITHEDLFVQPGPADVELDPEFLPYIESEDVKGLYTRVDKEKAKLKELIRVFGLTPEGLDFIAAHARYYAYLLRFLALQKVDPVIQLVKEELDLGLYDKIVVFFKHNAALRGVEMGLHEFKPCVITGQTRGVARQNAIDRFQEDPDARVFLGNLRAAGEGLNLTSASQVLMVERDPVPGYNGQAMARCHRWGQKFPVTVRHVHIADSLDERLGVALARKLADLEQIGLD